MFSRTLDNRRTLRIDLLTGITFNDIEAELLFLGTTFNRINNDLNAYEVLNGTSNSILDGKAIALGTSISTLNNNLNVFEILTGSSFSNQYTTNQFLQNEIDALIIAGVSVGNVDILYGIQ